MIGKIIIDIEKDNLETHFSREITISILEDAIKRLKQEEEWNKK